jgi:long-chain fatty acid transport protein
MIPLFYTRLKITKFKPYILGGISMIGKKRILIFKMAIVLAASAPMLALATNGMNPEGSGAKSRGMGGAGVAMATETQSIINNPATVNRVGNRQDIALGLFSPNDRGYTYTGPAPYTSPQTSDDKIFPIPFYGYSRQLDDGAAWAFTVSAVGGMNTDYPVNFGAAFGACCTGPTGLDLSQLSLGATYGGKMTDSVSWGVTASLVYQRFEAEGLQVFQVASSDPANMTNNGVDDSTGIGLMLGLLGEFENGATWGASYKFKTDMSEFDKYKGLFPDQGKLDIAPTFTIGVALPVGEKTTLALDYHYIDYEAVTAISNATSIFDPFDTTTYFGTSDGPGFGWQSISVIKAGIAVETSPTMIWRGGVNIGESPLVEAEFSTAFLVPATITTHVTVGFTKTLKNNNELTMVYVRSLEECQSGPFSADFGGGTLEACMEQNFLELSYGWVFK